MKKTLKAEIRETLKVLLALATFVLAYIFLFIAWLSLAIANTFGRGYFTVIGLTLVGVLLLIQAVKLADR